MVVYSRQVVYAPDEKRKVDQFIFRLRDDIAQSISQREFTTYDELLKQCYTAEDNLKGILEEGDQYKFGQKDQERQSHKLKPKPPILQGKARTNAIYVQPT